MADVTWQEAMNVLEGLQTHYRSFEKLHEVAVLMASQEQAVAERQQRVDAIEMRVAELEYEIQTLEETKANLEKSMRVRHVQMSDEAARMDKEAEETRKAHDERMARLREDHEQDLEALIEKFDIESAPYRVQMADLQREIARLQTYQQDLTQKIEAIKEGIGRL
jgi:chromosome segregation ATPase